MKKLLPQTKSNPSGFTLIELLVVVAIIAILAVVGIALFSGIQSKARDTKRVQDIIAISRALEAQYKAGTGYSTTVNSTWFADQQVPKNPSPYGVNGSADYNSTLMTVSSFYVCAAVENSTGNADNSTAFSGLSGTSTGPYFCKRNSQ